MYIQFAESESGWMVVPSLHQGGLYIIDARNAYLGVWYSSTSGFQIARARYSRRLLHGRMKWDYHSAYLFEEKHWDCGDADLYDMRQWDSGEPPGTAKPLVFLELVPPSEINNLLAYLLEAGARFPREIAQDLVSKRMSDPV